MTADLFETFGDSLIPQPVKRQREQEARKQARAAIPPMVKHGLEKEQIEKQKQLQRYRLWKSQVRDGMSRGDYGIEIIELLKQLRRPSRAKELVQFIQASKWMLKCSLDVRLTMLGYIDHAITRHRIRNGWPPFDDALPGELLNAFLIIRKHLIGT
jgi:hypothetical protein